MSKWTCNRTTKARSAPLASRTPSSAKPNCGSRQRCATAASTFPRGMWWSTWPPRGSARRERDSIWPLRSGSWRRPASCPATVWRTRCYSVNWPSTARCGPSRADCRSPGKRRRPGCNPPSSIRKTPPKRPWPPGFGCIRLPACTARWTCLPSGNCLHHFGPRPKRRRLPAPAWTWPRSGGNHEPGGPSRSPRPAPTTSSSPGLREAGRRCWSASCRICCRGSRPSRQWTWPGSARPSASRSPGPRAGLRSGRRTTPSPMPAWLAGGRDPGRER